jgi:hypothetical protein
MAKDDGLSTVYHLNRLAGTIVNSVPQLDINGAASQWAFNVTGKTFTRGIEALNAIYAYRNSGKNFHLDTPGVLNALAGVYGYGEAAAASRIVS